MATKWVYHFEEGNAEIPDIQGHILTSHLN